MFERYTGKGSATLNLFLRVTKPASSVRLISKPNTCCSDYCARPTQSSAATWVPGSLMKNPSWRSSRASAIPREKSATSVDIPLSNQCKRVLAYAAEESVRLGDQSIGPEHLLLGLLRETGCFAQRALTTRGAELKRLRKELSESPRENSGRREPPLPAQYFRVLRAKTHNPAIIFAMYEASRFGSSAIETEHLLLGLVHEDKPTVDRLFSMPTSPKTQFGRSIEANGTSENPGPMNLANMPLADQGKRALASAVAEAGQLGHKAVGPEHLLLGLLYETDGFGAQMLIERG